MRRAFKSVFFGGEIVWLRIIGLTSLICSCAVQFAPSLARLCPALVFAAETDADEANCLATTVYWEARAKGENAMIAVAWVVLNRVKSPDFPDTICKVVREGGEKSGCQFSYWCDGKSDVPKNEEAWNGAKKIAAAMLTKPPKDPTGGALFFHSVDVASPWTVERKRTAQVGDHIFYR